MTFSIIAGMVILAFGYSFLNQISKPAIGRYDLISLFDEFDSGVNDGNGYSGYLNTDGFPTGALLSWSESYLMQAYANMYRATSNVKYLDKLHRHIQSILANRDDKIGHKDYKGRLVPSWGVTKYSRNKEYTHTLITTSMIVFPMLEFINLVKYGEYENRYQNIEDILKMAEESILFHETEWMPNEKGRYHYQFTEDSPIAYGQRMHPTNFLAAAGRNFIMLYIITKEPKYLERVTELARQFKNSLSIGQGGAYIWGYRPYPIGKGNRVEDISHATLEVDFARLCYENRIVFEKRDMERFAKTIKQLAVNNRKHFPKYLDGSGDFDYEIAAGEYALLAEFDKGIYDLLVTLFFNHLKVDQTAKYMQEDWWGVLMSGMSRLILYQSTLE